MAHMSACRYEFSDADVINSVIDANAGIDANVGIDVCGRQKILRRTLPGPTGPDLTRHDLT